MDTSRPPQLPVPRVQPIWGAKQVEKGGEWIERGRACCPPRALRHPPLSCRRNVSSTPGHTMSHQPLMALNDDDPAVRQPAASDAASAALFMEGGGRERSSRKPRDLCQCPRPPQSSPLVPYPLGSLAALAFSFGGMTQTFVPSGPESFMGLSLINSLPFSQQEPSSPMVTLLGSTCHPPGNQV